MGGKQVETYESMITPRNVSGNQGFHSFIDGKGGRGRRGATRWKQVGRRGRRGEEGGSPTLMMIS